MKSPQSTPTAHPTGAARPHLSYSFRHSRTTHLLAISILLLIALLISACGAATPTQQNNGGATVSNQPGTDKAPAVDAVDVASAPGFVSNAGGYPVKVFFSKRSNPDFASVGSVDRISPTKAVATFALQLLIAGPTPSERDAGYYTELNTMLSGDSACLGSATPPVGGPDFTLVLDKRGTTTETGTATVKFCRTITSNGIGADARVTAQITATLKQFSTIKNVVILTKEIHCLGDESGQDLCLRS